MNCLFWNLGEPCKFLNVALGTEEVREQFCKVVGLVDSRGVNRVMPIEVIFNHSKRLAI